SKLAGVRAVAASDGRTAIVRTSWLYGAGGRDFVDVILQRAKAGERLRVVNDQCGRPTWTVSMAHQLEAVVERQPEGILHCADRGMATWYALARKTLQLAGQTVEVEAVGRTHFPGRRRGLRILSLTWRTRRSGWASGRRAGRTRSVGILVAFSCSARMPRKW
ncbi:MAG: sugar nucleotide-binding protein, partial [Dehalococcoidia bacterium]